MNCVSVEFGSKVRLETGLRAKKATRKTRREESVMPRVRIGGWNCRANVGNIRGIK